LEAAIVGDPTAPQFSQLVPTHVADREGRAVRHQADGENPVCARSDLNNPAVVELIDCEQAPALCGHRAVVGDRREGTSGVDSPFVRVVAQFHPSRSTRAGKTETWHARFAVGGSGNPLPKAD
jgi:hypothetical protein